MKCLLYHNQFSNTYIHAQVPIQVSNKIHMYILQKHVRRFLNHRVVTLVADKLVVLTGALVLHKATRAASAQFLLNHNTLTTLRTSVKGVITNGLQCCFHALNASRCSLTDVWL